MHVVQSFIPFIPFIIYTHPPIHASTNPSTQPA